ncbi:MAG: hypothetical protein AUJ49_13610 [Desulfovibrionaceae bacterium CG1_02_65_16]|nr:MAG: hypothetical protein AUJ49_13610 [Desulfovibrionaceae bacterium CG1_02_65_16]
MSHTHFALAAPLLLTAALFCAPGAAGAMAPRPQAAPAAQNATQNATNADENPTDADGIAQYRVLREYFEWQATMDDRLPSVFSRRVRGEETMAFLGARENLNHRGQLERFRAAKVNLSGLTFKRITKDPDLARIQVTGNYTFTVPPVVETVTEDALFVLLPEKGTWKIYERRAGWR